MRFARYLKNTYFLSIFKFILTFIYKFYRTIYRTKEKVQGVNHESIAS